MTDQCLTEVVSAGEDILYPWRAGQRHQRGEKPRADQCGDGQPEPAEQLPPNAK